MSQRFFVLACATAMLISSACCGRFLQAQEEPQETPPAKSPAAEPQEAPKTDEKSTAEPATPPKPSTTVPGGADVRAAFDAKFAEWIEALKELRRLQNEYRTTPPDDIEPMLARWNAQVAKTEAMIADVLDAAMKAYEAEPNTDRNLTRFLVKMLEDQIAADRYDAAVKLSQLLVDKKCDMEGVLQAAGIANFSVHNFEKANEYLEMATQVGTLDQTSDKISSSIEDYIELWKQEQQVRAKEAEAGDLPRVKLITSKGEVLLELFENEAPDTVGNFVSLVESGFYDGLSFHRVLPGFMAQGGCPTGDGSGGPGYTIYDECKKPGSRSHFRGSLSMAKTQAPDSGGSQFFITFRPTPPLNGLHTVFGRVIEGMDVVDRIQRRDPSKPETAADPDKIVKAEVVRKRDHEYLPKKVD